MIKNNRNMIFYIMFITSILLLILAYFICENNNKESEKYDIKVTKKHYYLHNNLELSTMEIKDEEIPLSQMSTRTYKIRKLYSKVPMSARYQKWIDKKCKKYGISTNVVLGVMKVESNFKVKISGDRGRSLGLMQIQKRYHTKRMKKLSATNLLDAYDNATVGVDYLAELYKSNGRNWHKTLMAYNGGQYYANRRVRYGIYSSNYSRKVMKHAYIYKANRK